MISNKINLGDIPTNHNYEGYLWKSNADSPQSFHNQTIPPWPVETENPFIIEGNLYNRELDISYSIRFIDGVYYVNSFEMKNSQWDFTTKSFLPNRISGVQHLCFRQYWKPESDSLCEGMEVLKPAMNVFVGFKYKEI
ncbi:MAG: TIGR04423 family type III CRISPR-associated protein [Bacteroidales bacterium]|nr:TIGR04423 family type III CRISPR-associated protein [Bacteroidales bacterium]